jgi:ferric-dicitrate binding protein FerR (iron transport regulator)
MSAADYDRRERLRSEGRERACEGIIRSQFGKRPTRAGTDALRKLRASDHGFWTRSRVLRAGALAACMVLVVLALAWALIVSTREPGRSDTADRGDEQAAEKTPTDKKPRQRRKSIRSRRPGAVRAVDRTTKPDETPKPDRKEQPEEPKPRPEPKERAVLASVGKINGEVKVRHEGERAWKTPEVLASIVSGDIVMTEAGGLARLDLEADDYVCLNSEAEVTIDRDSDEFLFKLGKGEIFVEKTSLDGSVAVETDFGRVSSSGGKFSMQKCGEDKYLLNVLDGEVECHERGIDHRERYGERTQAYFERGKPCDRGMPIDTEKAFAWAEPMRPKRRSDGPGRRPGRGRHGPSRSGGMMFRKILEKFDELDANGDGRLSAEEANFPEQEIWDRFMENVDTDGDGELSSEECKALLEKMKERKGPGRRGRSSPRGEEEPPDEGR